MSLRLVASRGALAKMAPRVTSRPLRLQLRLSPISASGSGSGSTRTFAQAAWLRKLRPNIPFLSQPSTQVRWKTTDKKRWLSPEVQYNLRYSGYLLASLIISSVLLQALYQEHIERIYSSPDEWSFMTRYHFRMATDLANPKDPNAMVRWTMVLNQMGNALMRLEDPGVDGDGVIDLDPDNPPTSDWIGDKVLRPKDITGMSDNWKRGYFEAMIVLAKSATIFDGWLHDRTLNWDFPPECVLGPDNPKPKPVPPNISRTPKAEDCEPVITPPASRFYEKIFATVGLGPREKMAAALQYATFLEFKGRLDEAAAALDMALDLADTVGHPYSSTPPYDPQTLVIPKSAKPSANHLEVLTAIGTYKARNGAVDEALPILISILRARRQLHLTHRTLDYPKRKNVEKPDSLLTTWERLEKFFGPPPYPGSLPDGSSPPPRDAAERCEEAALNAYIGEIMFARGSREDGLAWTREAVDISEEQMHNINDLQKADQLQYFPARKDVDELKYRTAATKHCRECLKTGLTNWKAMVERMTQIQEEEAEKQNEEKKQWWVSWGAQEPAKVDGRWETEIKVVEERQRRATQLLDKALHREGKWYDFILAA